MDFIRIGILALCLCEVCGGGDLFKVKATLTPFPLSSFKELIPRRQCQHLFKHIVIVFSAFFVYTNNFVFFF